MCAAGVCARVLGQSGKIDFEFEDQNIQVAMDSITEVDEDGDVVGNTGSVKHSFNSFASQDFTFSDIFNTSYQGIDAVGVNFTASLVDDTSTFYVTIYLLLEDGNVTVHNEDYFIARGSFKFSYYWDYWPFCTIGGSGVTSCTKGGQEQEGAYLDFTIVLKDQGNGASVDENSTLTYSDGSEVYMPVEYYANPGGWGIMPEGYPLEEIQGSQTIVTFRYERFDGSLEYDPILNWGTDDLVADDDDDGDGDTCFSGSENILLESGGIKAISDVVVGDKVQVVTTNGDLGFSEVVFLPHSANTQKASFVELQMTSGKSLRATPDHFIVAGSCGTNSFELLAAKDISEGHCVRTTEGDDKVMGVNRVVDYGVYTVVTKESSGLLVVNGVFASSFGFNHWIVNMYYNIHRIVFNIAPSLLTSRNVVAMNLILGDLVSMSVP